MSNPEVIYKTDIWDNYSKYFFGVTISFQTEVYKAANKYLNGKVIDFGCGTAKLAPILLDNKNINSYTGVDASENMVGLAQQTSALFEKTRFTIIHGEIESINSMKFSSGVSINSFYSWPQPVDTLRHIFSLLKAGAIFILATPNKTLNMDKLLYESEKELIGHPYFKVFKEMNLSLANNDQAKFIPMDKLIQQVQSVGFQVQSCNQEFFLGGLNFLVMTK